MLSFAALANRLGLSRPQLTALVRDGLPHVASGKQKLFDPDAVAAWLIEHGKATRDEPPPAPSGSDQRIAVTRGEAAQALGVSLRTLADWLLDPSFPGRAGPPGRRDGYFPLEEIADWWAKKNAAVAGPGAVGGESPRERLVRLRADQEEIELAKARGQVLPVVEIERLLRRTIATTKAVLSPLADELLVDLPVGVPAEAREQLRQRVSARLNEAFANIAKVLSGDEEESDAQEKEP